MFSAITRNGSVIVGLGEATSLFWISALSADEFVSHRRIKRRIINHY